MANENDNICVVCFKNVEIFSIGCCDHVVCYECSTRMRVLCRQNECPICRQEMQLVVFTSKVKAFAELKNNTRLFDKKYNIAFATPRIEEAFYRLLEHNCKICNNRSFRTFKELSSHMRKEHDRFYCHLCVDNLKILTSERRCYTSSELSHHTRKGDIDDKSHKGHPLCKFCDIRYNDNDDLYRHLRRDHLYCHFCDADGHHMYYSSYDYLREHFRQEHFLCEEGTCIEEKFTPVFRTEIDLKAHRASEHGRSLGKAAMKQARTLELEFTLKPRPRQQDNKRRGRPMDNVFSEEGIPPSAATAPPSPAATPSLGLSDFPLLGDGGGPASAPLTNISPQSRLGALTIRGVASAGPQYDQHFPGLPSSDSTPMPSTSVRVNINQDRKPTGQGAPKMPANLSIQVNHRLNRNVINNQDAFPALPNSSQKPSSTTWVSVSAKKPAETKKTPAPAPQLPSKSRDEDFPSLCTKFTTNVNFTSTEPLKPNFTNLRKVGKAIEKKASSVMIPMEKSWPEPEVLLTTPATNKTKARKKKRGGSEDTVKKKLSSPEPAKTDSKPDEKKDEESALKKETNSSGKPLPTAEDWFDTKPKKVEPESDDDNEEAGRLLGQTKLIDFSILKSGVTDSILKSNDDIFLNRAEKPPPGFAPICPPPGFSIPPANGLTFTNSSGENFSISPRSSASYVPLTDFDARNRRLITKVNEILLNDSSLDDFRSKSLEFKQGIITADEYYNHCLMTMGTNGTMEVLPELIVLLPDIAKQQELFAVFIKEGGNKQRKLRLQNCTSCHQVVPVLEMKQHQASHIFNTSNWNVK